MKFDAIAARLQWLKLEAATSFQQQLLGVRE